MCFAADPGLRTLGVHASAGIRPADLLDICSAAPRGKLIYSARNTIWAIDWGDMPLAVKAFRVPRGIRQWIYGCIRTSKAKRSFDNATALISLGLCTPKPIGFVEYGSGVRLLKSFYVSEYLPASSAAFPLRDALLNTKTPNRESILLAFGCFTRRLHDLGVLHRDYSPGNILVVPSADSGDEDQERHPTSDHAQRAVMPTPPSKYRFGLVDLNRMSFQPLSIEQRMHNLRLLWAEDDDLRTIVAGYALQTSHPLVALQRAALRASHTHKFKATREERWKRAIRKWIPESPT